MSDEATYAWVNPMLLEIWRRDDHEWYQQQVILMSFGAMPAAELATPMGDWLDEITRGTDTRVVVMDWVRLGQLMRERLGWYDYPEYPPTQN